MKSPPDDRSAIAVAGAWASRVITVSAEMVIPGLAGYWLDNRLHTKVLFTVLGFGGGLVLGMWHLLRLTSSGEDEKNNSPGGDHG